MGDVLAGLPVVAGCPLLVKAVGWFERTPFYAASVEMIQDGEPAALRRTLSAANHAEYPRPRTTPIGRCW